MVDVAEKPITVREARARCQVRLSPEADRLFQAGALPKGHPQEVIRLAAEAAVTAYVAAHHKLGHDITLSGLYAALHQPGVQKVALAAPVADLVVAANAASYCTGIVVAIGGTDE